jgi:uncharacterized protein YndB with AHSA1/START domain
MPPEFEVRREVTLPASPEEVWEAVTTSQGNAAWLFPSFVERDDASVKAWERPHRFAVRHEQGEWFNALEFEIEGREGGTSKLRYVHSGIFVEDWDTQYDAAQQHTDFYLHTLGEYLAHFKGRPVAYIGDVPQGLQGPPGTAAPDGFKRLREALGLGAELGEGDAVRLAPEGLDPVAGVVDYERPNFLGVRSADALYCLFGRNAFGSPVGMSIHMFADGVDAEQTKRAWRRWLDTALA